MPLLTECTLLTKVCAEGDISCLPINPDLAIADPADSPGYGYNYTSRGYKFPVWYKRKKCEELLSKYKLVPGEPFDDLTDNEVASLQAFDCNDPVLKLGKSPYGGLVNQESRGVSFMKTFSYAMPSTTPSTTAMSTGTTTGTSSASTSETTSGTTSETSTATSTITSSAISSDTSTATSTVTTTAFSSVTSTGTTTVTSTETVSLTTTVTPTSTATTSATSTVTTLPPDVVYKVVYSTISRGFMKDVNNRRFGNAFKKSDRVFYKKFDGSNAMKNIETTRALCEEECTIQRDCLGVFTWNQIDHVPKDKRMKPDKPTGFSCVGLKSPGVYGDFFSDAGDYPVIEQYAKTAIEEMRAGNSTDLSYRLRAKSELQYGDDMEQTFTGDSISSIKRVRCRNCRWYSGSCLHEASGFCMDEKPGTAQCLKGFTHCNLHYYDKSDTFAGETISS